MPGIRYICLSDLHLGEEDSLLTAVGESPGELALTKPSPVLERLGECLRALVGINTPGQPKPTLILAGDVLELALATTDQAAMAFERFLETAVGPDGGLFDRIVYIPGNHDHHLWESTRESLYASYARRRAAGQPLGPPWHATNLDLTRRDDESRQAESPLIVAALERTGVDVRHTVAYPNFAVRTSGPKGARCLVFTHGHYVEPMYRLMTRLRHRFFPEEPKPLQVWDIEAENFAWIDFFWSAMGRSGKMGAKVEAVYERLRETEPRQALFRHVAGRLTMGRRILARPIALGLACLAARRVDLEKHAVRDPLTRKAEQGLKDYVNGPLLRQMLAEWKARPRDTRLVFGHTHKPFFKEIHFHGFGERLPACNTGGWVVESTRPHSVHGASIAVADSDLNLVAMNMYNESARPEDYHVELESGPLGQRANPLNRWLRKSLVLSGPPWTDFSEAVAGEIRTRKARMRERLSKPIR